MSQFILSAFSDEASPMLDEQIAALRANGVSQMEMRGVNGHSVADLTPEEAKQVAALLADHGIAVSAMGSPYGKIGVQDEFQPHLEKFRRSLEICGILGTKRMRMFSFYLPAGEEPARYRDEVFSRLERMLEAARPYDVLLCHENEKGIYGDNAERCLELAKTFRGRMGVVFDPANFIQCFERPADIFDAFLPYIDYLHIKDALLADGAVVPAGCGDGHIAELLERIAGRGDAVTLSVEPHLQGFVGLDQLQSHELTHRFSYPDAPTAFSAAVGALQGILTTLGFQEDKGGRGTWTR